MTLSTIDREALQLLTRLQDAGAGDIHDAMSLDRAEEVLRDLEEYDEPGALSLDVQDLIDLVARQLTPPDPGIWRCCLAEIGYRAEAMLAASQRVSLTGFGWLVATERAL